MAYPFRQRKRAVSRPLKILIVLGLVQLICLTLIPWLLR